MVTLNQTAIFILFAVWGIGSFVSAWARQKRYRSYQRDLWLLTDAVERFLMAFAFLGSALIQSPHPVASFDWLKNYVVLAWLIAFVPFSAGILLDWRSLAVIRIARSNPEDGP